MPTTARAGLLLTVALTLEILSLGLTVSNQIGGTVKLRAAVVGLTASFVVLLPLGALVAEPIALLPPTVVTGFLAFGLIALLYLVTEELLVEADETEYRPWVTTMFFIGFLLLLLDLATARRGYVFRSLPIGPSP